MDSSLLSTIILVDDYFIKWVNPFISSQLKYLRDHVIHSHELE